MTRKHKEEGGVAEVPDKHKTWGAVVVVALLCALAYGLFWTWESGQVTEQCLKHGMSYRECK